MARSAKLRNTTEDSRDVEDSYNSPVAGFPVRIHNSFPPMATPIASYQVAPGATLGKPTSNEPYYKRPEEKGNNYRSDESGYGTDKGGINTNFDEKSRG